MHGQCYDGARIQLIQHKTLFVHFFAHSLTLCVQDAVCSIPLVRDIMQCLRDLGTWLRARTKRAHTFQAVANGLEIDNPISLKPLCPTRWTVRLVAIGVALQSYPVIKPMPFLSEVAKMATVNDSASFSQFEDSQTML